ncbi:MAG: acetyltransferase [Phycisphaerales bacterium]|nr:acetyltransferase [Phycisphaerales bacterium]
MSILRHDEYEIDPTLSRVDFATVATRLAASYWSPGIPRATVERAARHSSLVVGAYHTASGHQAAYLRVISDRTTFAYLADVWVGEPHRRRGLAQAIVRYALAHPDHQGLRRWMLLTDDAHPLYRQCGFEVEPHPGRVMTFRPPAS